MNKEELFESYVSQLGFSEKLADAVCKLHKACFESDFSGGNLTKDMDDLMGDFNKMQSDFYKKHPRGKKTIEDPVTVPRKGVPDAILQDMGHAAMNGTVYSPTGSDVNAATELDMKPTKTVARETKPVKKQPDQQVRKMQEELINNGYSIKADGIWGPKTQAAWDEYKHRGPKTPANPGKTHEIPTSSSAVAGTGGEAAYHSSNVASRKQDLHHAIDDYNQYAKNAGTPTSSQEKNEETKVSATNPSVQAPNPNESVIGARLKRMSSYIIDHIREFQPDVQDAALRISRSAPGQIQQNNLDSYNADKIISAIKPKQNEYRDWLASN